jgi:SSS family solute:Na+ symporter
MQNLNWLDLAVILGFFVVVFWIAGYYARKAGKDTGEFFLSGRDIPWFIAGTAMVATTFAADTPLAVTELVARNGIAGNWLWWNLAIGGMLTVFFFARLWRRAGIMTDVEFVELRYSGKAAAALRGFRAVYLGLFMNAIVLGWVNKAMEKIFKVTVPEVDPFLLVVISATILAIYASASGLAGTARTDSFQFVFAMVGCIILAAIVVGLPQVGGILALKRKLAPQLLDFLPRVGSTSSTGVTGGALAIPAGAFLAYVGVQWWSAWYPGADPGGGGYVAQRMMSAKDEKHSLFATLWFTIAHYTIRPWPWILVALAALVLLPRVQSPDAIRAENPALFQRVEQAYQNTELLQSADTLYQSPEFRQMYEKYENTVDPGIMYPKLMLRVLPPGLLGLLIAVFLAAYMSTLASQLNWGTSYLINDFYRRFIKPQASEKHYVRVSRVGVLLMTVFSLVVTRVFLTRISGAWEFVINASAGMGAVLILRWFWWRINAWSEIAAMAAPLIIYPVARYQFDIQPPITLYPTVLGTTVVWIVVTYLTKPVEEGKLIQFFRRTHPGGAGWRHIAAKIPDIKGDTGFGRLFMDWMLGVVVIYAFLFGLGDILFGDYLRGALILALGLAAAGIIYYDLSKRGLGTMAAGNPPPST